MRRRLLLRFAAILLLLAAACSTPRAEPPDPDAPPELPPSLAGHTVMVLPAQPAGVQGDSLAPAFDAELAHFLAEQAPRVRWVPATAVERAAARSPSLRIRTRALAVDDFRRMRMVRIGEPLFTDLHALGLLLDARVALLPWAVGYQPGTEGGDGRIEVAAALIDTRDGDVLWQGALSGTPGPLRDPATVASAASALAQRMAR